MEIQIKLNTISDVKEFCRIANHQDFSIDVLSGRCLIDAKSILGLLSLDRSRPIKCMIQSTGEQFSEFVEQISKFVSLTEK